MQNTALFLDVDGTLVELADHPHSVVVDADLLAHLHDVEAAFGRAFALVSGRALEDLDRMFKPAAFAAAGGHGTQIRMHDGTRHDPPATQVPATVLNMVEQFADTHPGMLLEHKAAGFSLHYRQAPALESAAREMVDRVIAELGSEFRLIDGKMVLEIAPKTHSKGIAIRHFLDYSPFSGRRPVFVGDDVTDEDGFRTVNELGGISVRVGASGSTAADYVLEDVNAVRQWLSAIFDDPGRVGEK